MTLYHGTNTDFCEIDISRSKPFKDFGRGFYLTDIYVQAQKMAEKKALIMGGEPIVQVYQFDETLLTDGTLSVLHFTQPTAEWAQFVFNNRRRTTQPYRHHYDVVIGPIADDGVAYLLGRYEEGSFTIEDLARELQFRQLNRQYFFGTSRAIQHLNRTL